MKKFIYTYIAVCLAVLSAFSASTAHAYWVWTPKTNKWVNPKLAVKETPKEQMEWAMGFYEKGEFTPALKEFKQLQHSLFLLILLCQIWRVSVELM